MNEITEDQVLNRLTALCARGEHCEGEMREKMRRWGVDTDTQDRIIAYLVANQYVDDERYTRFFIKDKMQFNKWGRRKIEQALFAKRVKDEISQPLLDEIGENEWKGILLPLLKAKQKSITTGTPYEQKAKLMKFALSRGFTMDIIRACMDVSDME